MQTSGGVQLNTKQKGNTVERLNMQQGFQNGHRFPAYVFGKSKRIRNKNWELLEIQVLKKMIDNHYELLNSRHTNAMMNARKNLVWKRIADSINALGLHRRTIRELKIKWSNMRLTERRKSGNSTAMSSDSNDLPAMGSGNELDNSLSIVDISQSSFESDVELDKSGEQENSTDQYSSKNEIYVQQTKDLHELSASSVRKRPPDDKWIHESHNRYTDLHQNQRSEYVESAVPILGGMLTPSSGCAFPSQPSTSRMSPMAEQSSRERMTQISRSFNNTISQIPNESQNNVRQLEIIQNRNSTKSDQSNSHVDQDMSVEHSQPWSHDNFELRNNKMEATIVGRPRENVHDFSQDRIYMPGVVIKEEPSNGSSNSTNDLQTSINVPEWHNTATQTDWRLSCIREYPCPSLPVSEKDITAIKYEILKLERSQLVLKNENIELENTKLRLEIARMQSNL